MNRDSVSHFASLIHLLIIGAASFFRLPGRLVFRMIFSITFLETSWSGCFTMFCKVVCDMPILAASDRIDLPFFIRFISDPIFR
jgi:hypothetical protein